MRAMNNAFSRSEGWNARTDYITRNERSDSGAPKFDLFIRIFGSIYHRYNSRPFFLLHSTRENKIHQGNT
jgi:hypothetical protein